jgi:hypothetical protein
LSFASKTRSLAGDGDAEWLPPGELPDGAADLDGSDSKQSEHGHGDASMAADAEESKGELAEGEAGELAGEPLVLPPETEYCRSCGEVVESGQDARQCTACHGLVHAACGGVGGSRRAAFRCADCRLR